jgi:hypothetical protein
MLAIALGSFPLLMIEGHPSFVAAINPRQTLVKYASNPSEALLQ